MVTADYATVDPITGKLHILGAFREIYASTLPIQHKRMCLALTIEGEFADGKGPHELSVTLANEDGIEIFSIRGAFEMPKVSNGIAPHCNVLLEFNDLKFEEPGQYCFYVTVNGDEIEDFAAIQVVQTEHGGS